MSSAHIDLGHLRLIGPDEDLGPAPASDPASVAAPMPDRVVQTAVDRSAEESIPATPDPAADHGDAELTRRREDVERKYLRVLDFLDVADLDAVLLTRADSVAWFTSGADLGVDLVGEGAAAAVFVNRKCRSVVADNVQSPRVFEEELAGLGFQLKERPWHDDPDRFLAGLTHGRRVATDRPRPGLIDAGKLLRALRSPLTPLERQRLRELGRALTLAVEATARNFQPGETEADIAGHLAHRLLRTGIVPVALRIAADDRLERYRQPTFKAEPIRSRATIAAVGRRCGLCAAATRTVSFGPPDPAFREDHTLAAMVDATCIYFSRPDEPVAEVFRRARRIYEKFGRPHEWTLDYQGAQIGYAPREAVFRPDDPTRLVEGMAVCWSPTVGPARSEDTVVVDARGFEVVTEAQVWPKMEVTVKGYTLPRPGILER